MAERLLMGPPRNQPGVIKVNATTRPPVAKPAGEQAIGSQLYALIRQAIAEIKLKG